MFRCVSFVCRQQWRDGDVRQRSTVSFVFYLNPLCLLCSGELLNRTKPLVDRDFRLLNLVLKETRGDFPILFSTACFQFSKSFPTTKQLRFPSDETKRTNAASVFHFVLFTKWYLHTSHTSHDVCALTMASNHD